MYMFSDYTLRKADESDRKLCQEWIDADADHRGKVTADFFVKPVDANGDEDKAIEAFVLEDRNGEPVFFCRMSRAVRLDIQFGPASTPEENRRNATALSHGLRWLASSAANAGARQLIFESVVEPLIRFCTGKRLGFRKSPNELVCQLAPPDVQESLENPTQPMQHTPESAR